MTLPTRLIPALDAPVGAVGLGCMGLSWAYIRPEERDNDAAVALIGHALDSGITFIDTSDAYGAGHNEQLVGRAIQGRREGVVVATKCGLIGTFEDDRHTLTRDGRPEHIRSACDASLARLGVDVIDLYYLHRVDEHVPLEESWGALAGLVEQGKVRALGLSEVSVDQARLAHGIHPVAAVQSELSLWTRDPFGQGTSAEGTPHGDMVGWTREHDAVFVPFSPLGRGFLTGTLATETLAASDFRAQLPRFTGEAGERNQAIVDAVRVVADRHATTVAAVALAWVLAQGPHVIPIPGTSKSHHLDANLAAATLALTPADLQDLDDLPQPVGARY